LHWQFTSPAHVKGLAREVHYAVRAGSRASVWVTPVIVVWGEFAQVVGGGTCKFVDGDVLAEWLRDQPMRIAPSRVNQIAEAVDGALAGPDLIRRWARSVRPYRSEAAPKGVTWVRRRRFAVRRLRLSVWEGVVIGFDLDGHGRAQWTPGGWPNASRSSSTRLSRGW
jgi:hypothetical protein